MALTNKRVETHNFSLAYKSPESLKSSPNIWRGELSGWVWSGPRFFYGYNKEDVAKQMISTMEIVQNKPIEKCEVSASKHSIALYIISANKILENNNLSIKYKSPSSPLTRALTKSSKRWCGEISGWGENGTSFFYGDTKEDVANQMLRSIEYHSLHNSV
jgi:hypothetical protein